MSPFLRTTRSLCAIVPSTSSCPRYSTVLPFVFQSMSGPSISASSRSAFASSADDAKALLEDAEIDGPLIDWKTKGSTVEYLGQEDVDGTMAHKLRVVRKNGDINYVFLDPDHFLE